MIIVVQEVIIQSHHQSKSIRWQYWSKRFFYNHCTLTFEFTTNSLRKKYTESGKCASVTTKCDIPYKIEGSPIGPGRDVTWQNVCIVKKKTY